MAPGMRSFPFLLISIVSAGWLACSSTGPEDTESASASITDRELARGALGIMGATEVPPPAGETKSCGFTGCHSINTVTLAHWNDEYRAAMAILDSSRSTEEKINYFRQNPRDPETPFAPERLGFMSAGAHLVPGDDVSATRNPQTYKQALKFAALFEGQDALYAARVPSVSRALLNGRRPARASGPRHAINAEDASSPPHCPAARRTSTVAPFMLGLSPMRTF
jgi:hypothetical protein